MKTPLDLPADLVRAMKRRAAHDGRKLKDLAAELLERGLAASATPPRPTSAKPKIVIQATGRPLPECFLLLEARR